MRVLDLLLLVCGTERQRQTADIQQATKAEQVHEEFPVLQRDPESGGEVLGGFVLV